LERELEEAQRGEENYYKSIGAVLPYVELSDAHIEEKDNGYYVVADGKVQGGPYIPEQFQTEGMSIAVADRKAWEAADDRRRHLDIHGVDSGYYRKARDVWRGLVLQKGSLIKFRAPFWSDRVEELEKKLASAQENFRKQIDSKLSPEGQEALAARKRHMLDQEKLEREIKFFRKMSGLSLDTEKNALVKERERLAKNKKRYDARRKDLIERLRHIDTLDKTSTEFARLRLELKQFKKDYGIRPIGEDAAEYMEKRRLLDRWKNPAYPVRIDVPRVNYPGKEPEPQSLHSKEYAEANKASIAEWEKKERAEHPERFEPGFKWGTYELEEGHYD
jgi:hypothetical protein